MLLNVYFPATLKGTSYPQKVRFNRALSQVNGRIVQPIKQTKLRPTGAKKYIVITVEIANELFISFLTSLPITALIRIPIKKINN